MTWGQARIGKPLVLLRRPIGYPVPTAHNFFSEKANPE